MGTESGSFRNNIYVQIHICIYSTSNTTIKKEMISIAQVSIKLFRQEPVLVRYTDCSQDNKSLNQSYLTTIALSAIDHLNKAHKRFYIPYRQGTDSIT